MNWLRAAAAVVLAAATGFVFHVFYGRGWAKDYVQAQAELGRLGDIAREPYPLAVVVPAAATALIPVAFQVLLFVLIREKLPGRSGAAKGLWFGALLLAIGDSLIRMPVMSLIVGNPADVVAVQSAEAWIIKVMTGLIIGLLVPAGLSWQSLAGAKKSA
jgi:hypothetical protein